MYLTRQEFEQMMKHTDCEEVLEVPQSNIARYRMMFDSIDVDGNGFIAPEELDAALGDQT